MQTELERPGAVKTPKAPSRRWMPALAVLGAMVVTVVAVAAVLIVRDPGSDAAAAEGVARAFIEAQNAGDADAAIALLAPDATIDDPFVGDAAEGYREDVAWGQAVGWRMTVDTCTTNPAAESTSSVLAGYAADTEASCNYTYENDWTRALGLTPARTGARYRFVIEGGAIVHLIHSPDISGAFSQAWEAFRSWLFRNHPVDVGTLYEIGETAPKKDPAAVALWRQRTEEFVADQSR